MGIKLLKPLTTPLKKKLGIPLLPMDEGYGKVDMNFDESGRPNAPGYKSLRDDRTGLMQEQYRLADKYKGSDLNTDALKKMRGDALRDAGTDSAWAKQMLNQNQLDEMAQTDQAAASSNAAQKQAMNEIAAQGGLDGGSKFMMARGSMRDALRDRQDIRRNSASTAMGLRAQDETNRIDQLNTVQNMEQNVTANDRANKQGLLAAQQYDLDNAFSDHSAGENRKWGVYEENMKGFAANQQAQASAKAAEAQCFVLGTLIQMADGSFRAIEEIQKGDDVLGGGIVTMPLSFKSDKGFPLYLYKNVMVTGSHAVKEDGKFIRVKDSKLAEMTFTRVFKVFSLITEDHRIVIGGTEFADYDETDFSGLSDEDSLKVMNGDLSCLKTISEKNTAEAV